MDNINKLSGKAAKKEGRRVLSLFERSNVGSRAKWVRNEQKSWDFFLNAQLTDEEKRMLEESGMPTFIINRITPVIETMRYFATARDPRWRAVGTKGDDAKLASVVTDMIDYAWYISSGKQVLHNIVTNTLVRGKGYMHIYIDPNADKGLGEVKFESIDPFDVWVSPMTRDPYERDALYHIIKKDLPRHTIMDMLPDYADVIKRIRYTGSAYFSQSMSERDWNDEPQILPSEEEPPPSSDEEGGYEDILPYFEIYEPVRLTYYRLMLKFGPSEEELEKARAYIDKQVRELAEAQAVEYAEKEAELGQLLEQGQILRERYDYELRVLKEQHEARLQELQRTLMQQLIDGLTKQEERIVSESEYKLLRRQLKDEIVEAIPFKERRVRKTCVVGDRALYQMILPISHSPVIALPYTHTGTPYPMSAVTPLIGKQQEINKAHQIMIHHANLSSSLRFKYVEGEIDEDLWERYSASPRALLPYRPGFSQNGPQEIMPLPINNAFFTVEQEAKGDIEYMAGIQPPVMGIQKFSEETYRGLLAKDEFSTRRMRSWISNIMEPFLEHVGKVWMELARSHYTYYKVFRIVQPNDVGGWEEREVEINVPIYDDMGNVIDRMFDYPSLRYDIRIVPGSTLPLNRWMILDEYRKWFELGIIDDIAFLSRADLPDKDQIIERNSLYKKLQSRINELENALKDRESTIKNMQRDLVRSGIKQKVMMAEQEIDRSKTEVKMMDKLLTERMKDALKQMKQELRMEIRRQLQNKKGNK